VTAPARCLPAHLITTSHRPRTCPPGALLVTAITTLNRGPPPHHATATTARPALRAVGSACRRVRPLTLHRYTPPDGTCGTVAVTAHRPVGCPPAPRHR
jgi:hypothetical protein